MSSTAGGTVVWGTASNWNPSGAPAATDDVIFDYSNEAGTKTTVAGLNAAQAANSLTFGGSTLNGAFGAFELRASTSSTTNRTLFLGTSGQPGAGSITVDATVLGTQSVGTSSVFFGNMTITLASGVTGFTVINNSSSQMLNLAAKLAEGATPGSTLTVSSAGGVAQLGGANSYTGATFINGGTVLINGNQSAAIGSVSVNNAGTLLGGTGTIGGAVTVNASTGITGATNGTIGALTLKNGLTMTGASGNLAAYIVDLSNSSSDKLTITGNLDLGTAFDRILFQGTASAASYQLVTYTGILTGTFDTVSGLPSGYAIQYLSGEIDLVAVPESATWFGGVLAAVGFGFLQRGRIGRRPSKS